ncbi:MAG TPA: extracellular solute-binding protein [Trueperaceae bacterium]|nr:extracellular solute-binding protein [Trueperaceae bacterium]
MIGTVAAVVVLYAVAGFAMAQDPVTIRFTWWGNPDRDARTNQMVDLFMAEYPWITVVTEPTVFDGYFDKLATSTAAGDAPDVITMGGTYPTEYGAAGQLLDLTTVPDAVGLDNYEPAAYSSATLDGAVYGLPTGGNARGLLINLDLFEQAGVPVPNDSTWTWEEFVDIAGQLSANLPDGVYGVDWRLDIKEEFAAQRGPEMFLRGGGIGVTAETMADLFQIPLDLMANGGMPSAEQTVELLNTQAERTYFGQGKAAMIFAYSNNVQEFANLLGQRVNIIKIPGESQYASPGLQVLPSQYFTVYARSAHPEEAAMLVNWLLNEPEAAKIILGNRGLSFNPAIAEVISPFLGEFEAQSAQYLARVSNEGRAALYVPTSGKGEVDDVTNLLHEQVLFGLTSPQDAGEEYVRLASAIIPGPQ